MSVLYVNWLIIVTRIIKLLFFTKCLRDYFKFSDTYLLIRLAL